jgi:hypothetical protein
MIPFLIAMASRGHYRRRVEELEERLAALQPPKPQPAPPGQSTAGLLGFIAAISAVLFFGILLLGAAAPVDPVLPDHAPLPHKAVRR